MIFALILYKNFLMQESFISFSQLFTDRLIRSMSYVLNDVINEYYVGYLPKFSEINILNAFIYIFMIPLLYKVANYLDCKQSFIIFFSIYISNFITKLFDLDMENSSYVFVLICIMYIMIISSILYFFKLYNSKINSSTISFGKINLQEYLILYTIANIIKYCTLYNFLMYLQIFSIIFLVFPNIDTTTFQLEIYSILYKIFENLAIRGFVINLNTFFLEFSKFTEGKILFFGFQYTLIVLNPFIINSKLMKTKDILIYSSASNLHSIFLKFYSSYTLFFLFLSIIIVLEKLKLCMEYNCTILRLSASFCLTGYLTSLYKFFFHGLDLIIIVVFTLVCLNYALNKTNFFEQKFKNIDLKKHFFIVSINDINLFQDKDSTQNMDSFYFNENIGLPKI